MDLSTKCVETEYDNAAEDESFRVGTKGAGVGIEDEDDDEDEGEDVESEDG